MAQPYVGEIKMFGGNFAPAGWMLCQGQLLPISENETLFQLIGTTYGGDGQTTFGLPDLRGRIPIHMGNGYTLAQQGGTESVTLTQAQLPSHNHPLSASTNGVSSAGTPADATATTGSTLLYAAPSGAAPDATMGPLGAFGGSQPHDNMAPYLCVNFIISLFGIFPSQN
jgi:microcystin-dependent protein